jgi:hypothetical protein
MLGFGPLSSQAISGSPYALVGTTAAMVAVGCITFGGAASSGQHLAMGASGQITFAGSGAWTSLNGASATGGIVFGANPLLKLLGRAMVFWAQPDSLKFTAQANPYRFQARGQTYTFKGMR